MTEIEMLSARGYTPKQIAKIYNVKVSQLGLELLGWEDD